MQKNNAAHYQEAGKLAIAKPLYQLVKDEIIPGTGIDVDLFWDAFAGIIGDLIEEHNALLKIRGELQEKIDQWHKQNRTKPWDAVRYKKFLSEIGYMADEPDDFQITTHNVDAEIADIAGPQLIVPLDNARYLLNAVNARWGSLYDALYTSNAIPEADGCKKTKRYNPIRGEKVIQLSREFLDRHFTLEQGTHRHITHYLVKDAQLVARMGDGTETTLLRPQQFIGYIGDMAQPEEVLLCHHNLHITLCFGEGYFIGRRDHATIYDIRIESAITTIVDCEDAVSSVDTADKVAVYRNWLHLMQGTLVRQVEKNDKKIKRVMEPDKLYIGANGQTITICARSLLLIRNVGMHLNTDAVLYNQQPIPETMLDAMVTALCAKHDFSHDNLLKNSRAGSMYIVKPKLHGPDEVALANTLFSRVEDALHFARNTIKMGVMDEERRTSVNLKACIQAAKERIVFINTGFLDRTGDDIHTNMEAGAIMPKEALKQAHWLKAYETSNVHIGLQCGFKGRAQIGKGMWAMPDEMKKMMQTKIQHPKAGANTAWVPSPTAASLHALHYHSLNVERRQRDLLKLDKIPVDAILDIPIMDPAHHLTHTQIRHEIENNAQGILGYVSRWVGQGVGCSKVPDINGDVLMEDCATLRISSQHISNWLHHGIVTEEEVSAAMRRMAVIVDRQNRDHPNYQPMAKDFDKSIPFLAAMDLVLKGRNQPNGYTEFILYQHRKQQKAQQNTKR